jgi:uncharacterized protein
MPEKNALRWFELYTADFERARTFYEALLGSPLTDMPMPNNEGSLDRMAVFPSEQGEGVGGAIVKMEGFGPGPGGTLIYLPAEGVIDDAIARIPSLGGTVIRPKFAIGPYGFIAIFGDTEGNIVGLHSMS